jgi:hypothetical protein
MNADIEDLLCQGMQRFTADLQAPTGLVGRAARRRRRRWAMRSAAAAALTAGAVVLATGVVPGASDGGAAAASVVTRVDGALSAAGPGQIAQMTITTHSVVMPGATAATTTTAEEWSYGGQWRLVTYSPPGRLVYDEGFSSSSVYTLVSYLRREWARQPGLGRPAAPVPLVPGRRSCGPVVAALSSLFQPGLPGLAWPAGWLPVTGASALRAAVSCGTLAVAGRQRVDGIEAIKLTSRPGSPIPETIWVSPGTYLPVRVVVGSAFPGGPVTQADITWLRPTAQNLAELTVPIPAGFRRVPLAQAVTPILSQILGAPKPTAFCPTPAGPACKTGRALAAPFRSTPAFPSDVLLPYQQTPTSG